MTELFLDIVNMSISAGWLVLAVLALRLILKKAPKWVNVLLWGIVALRLICPFSIESALSLIPSKETISPEIMMDWTPEISTGVEALDQMVNPVISTSFAPNPGTSANPLQILIPVAANFWLLGVLILLAYTAISYLSLRHKLRTAVILRDNIFQCETVSSPFVLGILKPKIYLPYSIDGNNLNHVVAHEQAHIKRKDHWWKPLGFLLLTIYWFNPLMWVAYILLCRDIELACDEKVIAELGNEQRADYTQALVACAVNRRMIAACPLAFGEVGVKDRVKSIMNYRKPTFWIIIAALVVCVVVAVCFLTDPKDDNQLYAPEPFGHVYRVGEIVYQDLQYSFGYTSDTTPRYTLTSDYQFFVAGDILSSSDLQKWVQNPGAFEEVKLSGLNFDDYFKEPGNLSGWNGNGYDAESLRRQTKRAWRFDVKDNSVFYYLILTHSDKVFLTYGYDVGDAHAEVEEGSLIRWVFELKRTDLISCNALSDGIDAFVELAYFPDKMDRDTSEWPEAKINEAGTLYFSVEADTNALVVSEEYHRQNGNDVVIEKNLFEVGRNDDGYFTIDTACRGSLEDYVKYYIKIKGQSDVYAMKVVFDSSDEEWDLIPMVMVDGVLYLDTGYESDAIERTDHFDGEITSQVEGSKQPTVDDQSNFGTGYGYQYGATEGTIELFMNGKWWIFATEEARQAIQFPAAETEFSVNFAGNTSLQQEFVLTEDRPYWCILVENHGTEKIATEIGGEVRKIEPGTFDMLFSDEKGKPGTYSVSFATSGSSGMTGNAVCYTYKYRIEITGRLHNAVKDTTYILLTNIEGITFEQAWKASGLSSNLDDYFDPADAVFIGIR